MRTEIDDDREPLLKDPPQSLLVIGPVPRNINLLSAQRLIDRSNRPTETDAWIQNGHACPISSQCHQASCMPRRIATFLSEPVHELTVSHEGPRGEKMLADSDLNLNWTTLGGSSLILKKTDLFGQRDEIRHSGRTSGGRECSFARFIARV